MLKVGESGRLVCENVNPSKTGIVVDEYKYVARVGLINDRAINIRMNKLQWSSCMKYGSFRNQGMVLFGQDT